MVVDCTELLKCTSCRLCSEHTMCLKVQRSGFFCAICDRNCSAPFTSQEALRQHMISGHQFCDLFICRFCNMAYLSEELYQDHLLLHPPSNICERCGHTVSMSQRVCESCLWNDRFPPDKNGDYSVMPWFFENAKGGKYSWKQTPSTSSQEYRSNSNVLNSCSKMPHVVNQAEAERSVQASSGLCQRKDTAFDSGEKVTSGSQQKDIPTLKNKSNFNYIETHEEKSKHMEMVTDTKEDLTTKGENCATKAKPKSDDTQRVDEDAKLTSTPKKKGNKCRRILEISCFMIKTSSIPLSQQMQKLLLINVNSNECSTEGQEESCSYKCFYCGMVSLFQPLYIQHLHCHEQFLTFQGGECLACHKQIANQDELASHFVDHGKKRDISYCTVCKTKSRCFYLKKHPDVLESMKNLRDQVNKMRVACLLCGNKILCSKMRAHYSYHWHTRCQECGMAVVRKKLMVHMRKLHQKRKFECPHCSQVFTERRQLRLHSYSHTGERLYRCAHCPKSFRTPSNLSRHTNSHFPGKAFSCEVCLKRFTQRENLKTHMRVHTKDQPFMCDICASSFSHKCSLQGHLRIHEKKQSQKDEINEADTIRQRRSVESFSNVHCEVPQTQGAQW